MALVSLRVSGFSNPFRISMSISVSRNSIIKQRNPCRRRSRCRRMRSAAWERAGGSAVGAIAVISASCAIGCPCFRRVTQRPDPVAGVFVLIASPSCSNTHCLRGPNGFGPPRLMPTRPAFGVKPGVCSRLGPEWQDNGVERSGPATSCTAPGWGWRRMLIQPINNIGLEGLVLQLGTWWIADTLLLDLSAVLTGGECSHEIGFSLTDPANKRGGNRCLASAQNEPNARPLQFRADHGQAVEHSADRGPNFP